MTIPRYAHNVQLFNVIRFVFGINGTTTVSLTYMFTVLSRILLYTVFVNYNYTLASKILLHWLRDFISLVSFSLFFSF